MLGRKGKPLSGATLSTAGLDGVLQARAIVARFGQRDALAWWDDESLMPSGEFVMNRLFPRTASYAQAEVAIEAATLRHQALLPQPGRITLFRLPPLLESAVRQHFLSVKREVCDHPLTSQMDVLGVRQPLVDALLAQGLIDQNLVIPMAVVSVSGLLKYDCRHTANEMQ